MSGKKSLCSVLAGVVVLAGVAACKPSSVELAGMGYACARVAAVAAPNPFVSPSELEAHPGCIPFDIHLIVDPTVNTDEWVGGEPDEHTLGDEWVGGVADDDTFGVAPVLVSYDFWSDGRCFEEKFLLGMEAPPSRPDSQVGLNTGGDGAWLTYECLTQITPGEIDVGAGDRVWLREYVLDRPSAEAFFRRSGTWAGKLPEVDDEASGPAAEIPLYMNEALLAWEPDPGVASDFFYVPLAMIATIGLEPEGFKPYTEIAPPEGMTQVTPPSSDPEEIVENIKAMVMEANLGPHVVIEPDPGFAGAIHTFTMDRDTGLLTGLPNYCLIAPVSGGAPSEPSVDPPAHMYDGLDFAPATAPDVYEGGEEMSPTAHVAHAFEALGTLSDFPLTIYNIPVSGELLFSPDEPHLIELPYTFWITIAPVELLPQESGPPDLTGEPDLLRVIVSPAMGGSVTVSTTGGTQEPDYPAEGDWQGSLAFDYVLGGQTDEEGGRSVALSAEPAEGYRFVAWQTEDLHAEIEDPGAPTTRLTIHPVVRAEMGPVLTTVTAYFAAYVGEPPQDAFFDVMMGATIKPVSHTIEDESGCESVVNIDYTVMDLTGGQKPISYVQLDVDGVELTSWSGTPEPLDRYHNDTTIESDCSEVRVIAVKAINSEGQTMTATKEAPIPPLSTHFEYDIEDVGEGAECQARLVIDLQAVDLTPPDSPLVNVVVKGNGATWYDSGGISTDWHEHPFSRLVGCGNTYLVKVVGTDSDGNTHTYRETVEIPEGSPPDEPDDQPIPPPQTTLYAAVAAGAQCTSSGPECSCQLSVSFDGKDLTGGTYPVTRVVLRVNGQVWHDSGSISTTAYHQVVHKTVNCGTAFSIQLTVNNAVGQTATSSGSLTTPTP